ncbi:ShlB/FhaC/HecB family hemolysin secretion/activation protein [Pseudomonas oryzihabitans]|uniref:ShlB/FhaC/HecB family hemolysin secretion/activation protein n=1 Tax=Pseudomonas oryzihabitans TaxID=47885 RepID=UPI0011AA4D4D|nr:ShlB/FhaC/HecB family hemolysin secretion/activation protein [Pseudomonas psychrotolerans]
MNNRNVFALAYKPLVAAVFLNGLAAPVHAQVPPDAGTILQQLQPTLPSSPPSSAPSLQTQPKTTATLPESAPFFVKQLRITGNTIVPTDALHGLVVGEEGKSLTLRQVGDLAGRITAYYQNHGYQLTRAIIPAQTIRDGVVTIQVIEAHYGKVQLDNQSEVRDSLLQATIAPLHSGSVIDDGSLNRSLLLLSDIPGVGVAATLKPGSDVATSDLTVATKQNPSAFANVSLDNYGNKYTDRGRLSANFNVLNPLHLGDVLSATLLTTGSGMNYGRFSYEALMNGQGTRAGASYSYLRYRLGDNISDLDANGTAMVGSAWVRHPLMRSRTANVYVQAQFDRKQLDDRIDATDLRTDRHLNNWVLGLNGDLRDDVLAGAINLWSVGVTSGRVVFDEVNTAAQAQGSFSKFNLNLSRLQGLTPTNALYVNVAAQWSDVNLDSAEKMTIGGPYSVRAYDIGALSGDTGYAGTVELRHDLGSGPVGYWQAIAFVDSAYVKVNRHPTGNAENSGSLSGAGVGLNWRGPDQWQGSLSVANRIGSEPSLVVDQSPVRGWVTVSKAF